MVAPKFPYGSRRHRGKSPGSAAAEVCDLVVYPRTDVAALHAISVTVAGGTRVALVGANGAGKSTLLKALAGLVGVHSGEIRIYGNPVGACHHRVAYLPQRAELDWEFPISAEQLVLMGRYPHLGWLRRPGMRDRELVRQAMARLGVAALADRQIGQLSGGQKQRVLLARALVQEADLLLLDEPTSGVDEASRAAILSVLEDFAVADKAVVVATHDTADLERVFDRVIHLSAGQVTVAPQNPAWGMNCPGTVANRSPRNRLERSPL
jgi:ABC-type Mn2+/Zn2+ transport system ATPase subunit